jgi:membrane protein implicated in regulation of membrane protease activity
MNTLLSFTYWLWFGVAAVLIIFEVLLGASCFLLWLGIIAASVGITVWLAPFLLWQYQLLIFALGAIVSVMMWYHYLKTHPTKDHTNTLNRRAEQYVGRVFILSEPIVNGRGKIRVDDSSWQVEGADLPLNTKVEVIGVDGVILKVKAKAGD